MITYKFTRADGTPSHGGHGKWSLPRGKRPGAWRTVEGEIRPCVNGLHLCRPQDLLSWPAEALWEAEYGGEPVVTPDKIVVGKARLVRRVTPWNEKTARLLAVHYAARVLSLFEKNMPTDRRVRDCLLITHGFALGETAAGTAAEAAVWAAGAAAGAAEAAAEAAAEDAARGAEQAWQQRLLMRALKDPKFLERLPKELRAS